MNKNINGQHTPKTTPINALYDGAIRIRKDNSGRPFAWIRLSCGKWDRLHLQKWKEKHGPIPTGHVLACKTTDTLNTDPANWELITLAENLKRNQDRITDGAPYLTRKCKSCRQEFKTSNFWRKLCDDCKKSSKPTRMATCATCKQPFETTQPRQKFCGKRCRDDFHNQLKKEAYVPVAKRPPARKKAKSTTKICAECKKEFVYNHAAEKFCSDTCRAEANRKVKTAYYHRKNPKSIKRSSTNDRRKETVNPEDMPMLNRVSNRNDREKLRRAKIKSPDHTKMEFKHYDPKLRITRFFKTEEKYKHFLKTNQKQEA